MQLQYRSILVLIFSLQITVALAFCGSCGPGQVHAPYSLSQLDAQDRRAVEVGALCADGTGRGGSGVLLTGSTLVTALHVVNCAVVPAGYLLAPGITSPVGIVVTTARGELRLARVTAISVDRDQARLELGEEIPDVVPPRIDAPPESGDVCVVSASPSRSRSCGPVHVDPDVRIDVRVETLARVVHGNSGSGVYDEHGALIGIATRCAGVACDGPGGFASPLAGSGVVSP